VSTTPALLSAQIRAARALLKWTAQDLARKSAVSLSTIKRAELSADVPALNAANALAIRRAFEDAGVAFIDRNGGGPGVRLGREARTRSNKRAK